MSAALDDAPAPPSAREELVRQVFAYGVIGAVQLLVDWAAFVALSALAVPVAPANLCGRVAGALFGFWLNARYTFAGSGWWSRLGRRALARFALTWLAMALVSTLAMLALERLLGLQAAWLGKPLVDGCLAVLGFLLSKYWIYRR